MSARAGDGTGCPRAAEPDRRTETQAGRYRTAKPAQRPGRRNGTVIIGIGTSTGGIGVGAGLRARAGRHSGSCSGPGRRLLVVLAEVAEVAGVGPGRAGTDTEAAAFGQVRPPGASRRGR
jgi:hypothetical protein